MKLRLRSTLKLFAKMKSEKDLARHKELDSFLLAKILMLNDLILLSMYGIQKAYNIIKLEEGQEIVTQDGKSSEQQDQEEINSLISQLFDLIPDTAKPAQGITTQDGKSSQEADEEANKDKNVDQETDQHSEQQTDQKVDQEVDQHENLETDQEEDQEKDQEVDQETDQGA